MKIVKFTASDWKALTAVEIAPGDARVVRLTGRNAQGKTSILDAIAALIEGGSVSPGSIHAGADRCVIQADLGEIVVRRTMRQTDGGKITTQLTVEAANGARYKKPQDVLDGFIGALTFDPLPFMRASAKEQFNILRQFVPGLDFDTIDQDNQRDFEARTAVNRDVARLRAAAESERGPVEPDQSDSLPAGRIDESSLLTAMANAASTNADIQQEQQRRTDALLQRERVLQGASKFRLEADDFRRRALELDANADEYDRRAQEIAAEMVEMPHERRLLDVRELRQAIERAREVNRLIDRRDRAAKLLEEAAESEWESDALTEAMAARTANKQKAIASATMPVPGLGFGDGVVLYNRHPLHLASGAEALVVSVAIAMALNPTLRVILIRDGNCLDSSMWHVLTDLAEKNDFQVWVESVDESKSVGFVIEAGAVVSTPAQRELLGRETA